MTKLNLHKKLVFALATAALTAVCALPALATAPQGTPVVPGMDRRIPGKVESAEPGTPWAKTRRYTPPATNEPTIKPPVVKPQVPTPSPSTTGTKRV